MRIRLLILVVILFLVIVPSASAQTTTVTGQVTDSGGQSWNNGTFLFTLQGGTGAIWTGGTLNRSIPTTGPGNLSSSGAIPSTGVPDVNAITPGGSTWRLTVCSATVPQQCFAQNLTITGASQVLTVTPPAISIQVSNSPVLPPPVIVAYADSEITGAWQGFSYFNAVTLTNRTCSAGTVGVTGPCTAYVAGGGSGGGITFVASLPATCTPGVTASVQLNVAPYDIYDCTATNVWTADKLTQITGALTGQILTANNGAASTLNSPGVPGTDVNAATYTVRCDSATAILDRVSTIRFITTAPVVTMPDPTAAGCGSNFPVSLIASGVTVTVNRTSTAVFNIYNGSVPSLAQTTFNLTTGQYATLTSPDNVNWLVRVVGGGGGAPAFSAITGGTNTTAAMICDTGCSLASTPELDIGKVGTNGVLGLLGSTSGTAKLTAPAVAGTSTNPVVATNVWSSPLGASATPTYSFTGHLGDGMYWDAGPGVPVLAQGGIAMFEWGGAPPRFLAAHGNGNGFCWGTMATFITTQCISDDINDFTVLEVGTGANNDSNKIAATKYQRLPVTGTNGVGNPTTVQAGNGTGNSVPAVIFDDGAEISSTSGTAAGTIVHRQVINDTKVLSTTSATATTILSLNVAADSEAGAVVRYSVIAKDTTGHVNCVSTGLVTAVAENSAATIKSAVNAATGVGNANVCTGAATISLSFTITAANPAVLSVTPTWTTIVPTSVYIIYNYDDLSDASSTL